MTYLTLYDKVYSMIDAILEQPSVEELVNTSLNVSRLNLQINPLKRKQEANNFCI